VIFTAAGRILATFRFDHFGVFGAQSLSPRGDCAPRLRPTINYCFYYLQYFKKWDKLIDLEALATEHQKNPSWISRGIERELSGEKCISSLDIKSFRKNK
jgi:hypothetical protein